MTKFAAPLALAVAALCAAAFAHADVFDTPVYPQLPPHVRSVAEAASYYVQPLGYSFRLITPRTGDFRHLAMTPAPRPTSEAPQQRVEDALLALVPRGTSVYLFPSARAIAFGPTPPSDPVVTAPPAPEEATPVSAPAVGAADVHDIVLSVPPQDAAPEIESAPVAGAAIDAPAPQVVPPEATHAPQAIYFAKAGEWLRASLDRAAHDAGYTLLWKANYDFLIIADTEYTAETFPQAAAQVLRGTWERQSPLVLTEASNRVLIISQP